MTVLNILHCSSHNILYCLVNNGIGYYCKFSNMSYNPIMGHILLGCRSLSADPLTISDKEVITRLPQLYHSITDDK